MPTYLKARTSFFGASLPGPQGETVDVDVAAGQVVAADHPAVAGREHLFEPLDDATDAGRGRRRGPS